MVQKWKKFVDKVVSSGSRSDLADGVEDIIFGKNLQLYDIKTLSWEKSTYRIRIWNYRVIFKKTKAGNKILKINKRGDIY